MLQIKEKRQRYRNTGKKAKAANCGRGFQFKDLQKPLNLTMKIIQRRGKNRTVFFRQLTKRGERNDCSK